MLKMCKKIKTKIVKSKCLADSFVWLGFEYEKIEDRYEFKRTKKFDLAWDRLHALKNDIKEIYPE